MSRSPRVPAQTGTIVELTPKGTGWFQSEIGPVYVPYTVPGDRITAQIIKSTPNYAIGKIQKLIEAGPNRQTPCCPHFGKCGGCQLMHTPASVQLTTKYKWLSDLLPVPVLPFKAGAQVATRNRIQLTVMGRGRDLKLGLNRFHSQTVEPITQCPMTHPTISTLIMPLTKWLQGTHTQWDQVSIRCGSDNGLSPTPNCLVVLKGHVTRTDQAYITQTWRTLPISGVLMATPPTPICLGNPYTYETIHTIRHQVSGESFFQANTSLTPTLIDTVTDLTNPQPGDRGLDLYGGLGLFGIHLGMRSQSMTIVDTNAVAIQDATATIQAHRLDAIVAKWGDANMIHQEILGCDYAILDPPRTGLGMDLKTLLNDHGPKRLTYISCNPETFARDLKDLSAYQCAVIQPIDMFPNMVHIELVARLERMML